MRIPHMRATTNPLHAAPQNAYVALHEFSADRASAATIGSDVMKALANKFGAWRRYRNSIRELSRLTDRELADLGLNRYDIETVARRSAGF
jgi:uncharacterized protein YjiS (DUF1127 family)